jgi:hypothetical protein
MDLQRERPYLLAQRVDLLGELGVLMEQIGLQPDHFMTSHFTPRPDGTARVATRRSPGRNGPSPPAQTAIIWSGLAPVFIKASIRAILGGPNRKPFVYGATCTWRCSRASWRAAGTGGAACAWRGWHRCKARGGEAGAALPQRGRGVIDLIATPRFKPCARGAEALCR